MAFLVLSNLQLCLNNSIQAHTCWQCLLKKQTSILYNYSSLLEINYWYRIFITRNWNLAFQLSEFKWNFQFSLYVILTVTLLEMYNLVLSTALITWIGHRKEIRKLTFRALALRRWPIHVINSVDKTKLSCYTPHRRRTTVSFETCLFILLKMYVD